MEPTLELEVLRRFYSNILDVIQHPVGVGTMLFQEAMVSEKVDKIVTPAKPLLEKNAAIMRAVSAAVRTDAKKLWVLIAVLEKFAESAPVASRMRDKLRSHGLEGEQSNDFLLVNL